MASKPAMMFRQAEIIHEFRHICSQANPCNPLWMRTPRKRWDKSDMAELWIKEMQFRQYAIPFQP